MSLKAAKYELTSKQAAFLRETEERISLAKTELIEATGRLDAVRQQRDEIVAEVDALAKRLGVR